MFTLNTHEPTVVLTATAGSTTGNVYTFPSQMKASPRNVLTLEVAITGSPSAVNGDLEGSLDNSGWYSIQNHTATSSGLFHITNKPVKFIRAKLTTLTGGSSPTVTYRVYGIAE